MNDKVWVRLSKLVFSGVVAAGPLLGTLWLLYVIYKVLLRVGESMLSAGWTLVGKLSGDAIERVHFPCETVFRLLLPLLIMTGVGFFVVAPGGKHLVRTFELVVGRIPLVGFIYNSLTQFVGAIRELGSERKFKSVVYVEYPSPGCRLHGFVTGNFRDHQSGRDVTSVFVPTSPNPLTGFLLIVNDDKVEPSDMTVEQATKIILSAGLVTPE